MAETTKFLLSEDAIPTHWVNLLPDLPGEPLPPLNPRTMDPAGPTDLTPIFPVELIMQEVSGEPEIEIPDAVREVYRLWRPTPLFRARRLERALGTPAHIYYKYEGVSPAGSHKPNTAVAQAYANAQAGVKKPTTETGAGQWGSVLNHVLLHQTIIGQETIAQMEMAGEAPDVIIGCVGGGSNFGGLTFPWLRRKLRSSDGSGPRLLAVEPAACPTLTKGVYAYD